MNLREMMDLYYEVGLTRELAAARVCQDIVLKAIADGPLNRNVTIKGGVVMRSITQNNRRATRDIDLDFIHYPLTDEAIRSFVDKLNCIEGLNIAAEGPIRELKHQDYHGRSIEIVIRDEYDSVVRSKIDIGVHKRMEIEQEEYCFDVCLDDNGASLLKNTVEQTFVEKLRSLLIFGPNSRRYKDVYDMYYLKDWAHKQLLMDIIEELILSDVGMRESSLEDIVRRLSETFASEQYLSRLSNSRQRWIDDEIHDITDGLLTFVTELEKTQS